MKKLLFIAAIFVIALGACKTNEANYKAAYEKAKEKRTETGDSLTTSQLRSSMIPKMTSVGSENLPVLTLPVSVYRDKDNVPEGQLKKYLIVVGQFRQIFNAGSMAKRLAANGDYSAFVVFNRQKDYFVVAAATDSPEEAASLLRKIKADGSVVVREPYPYVLRPAQLVR